MPPKNYYTDLEKEKIYTIVSIKESIIALEHDVTKIHQNLKRIAREINYLYNAMAPEDFEKMLRSDIDEMYLISHIHLEKEMMATKVISNLSDKLSDQEKGLSPKGVGGLIRDSDPEISEIINRYMD